MLYLLSYADGEALKPSLRKAAGLLVASFPKSRKFSALPGPFGHIFGDSPGRLDVDQLVPGFLNDIAHRLVGDIGPPPPPG